MNTINPVLSKQDSDTFKNEGYLVLPYTLPPALLEKLRRLFDEEMNAENNERRVFNTINGKNYICNLDHLLKSNNLACLELLGWPPVLETAAAICGPDFFLIQEFAVIKMLGDTTEVLWHQDMLHQHSGNCFTMGIYLDDADENDGALTVVPKSHLSDQEICILKNEPSVEQAVKAGGILIHDMKLAHSSGIMNRNPLRRVLYFEFLSVNQALGENIYRIEQLHNRMRLIQLAIDYYQQQNPGEKKFEWANTLAVPPETPKPVYNTLQEIHLQKSLSKPSAYCFENTVAGSVN